VGASNATHSVFNSLQKIFFIINMKPAVRNIEKLNLNLNTNTSSNESLFKQLG
jgi:hypothetical protein